jgi:hypothetical protein
MDYYDLFSFSAKKAIYRASEICAQFCNQYVEPEHIFYSVLNLRSCSAVQVLHQLQVNLPKLTYNLEAHLYEHAGTFKGQPSFSARTLGLLDAAFREVKRLHHREIGTTHLLIALAQERSTFLRSLFDNHDLNPKNVRDTFMGHLRGYTKGIERGQEAAPEFPQDEPAPPASSETVVQAVITEAGRQARSWNHRSIEPVHLLAAIAHLFPDCLFMQRLIGNVKPTKLIYALLNSVDWSAEPARLNTPLSETSIDVLVDALRLALRNGEMKIGWREFTVVLMDSFSEAQRALIASSLNEPATGDGPEAEAAPFTSPDAPPLDISALLGGPEYSAEESQPGPAPPEDPAPPEAGQGTGEEE